MPRLPRNIIPNVYYHVTQQGNNGQKVFFKDYDRLRYLSWMDQYSKLYDFDILAWCLMTNHIHIVGIPRKPHSMGRTFQIVQMMHTQSVNKQLKRKGHLWHAPYSASPMDDRHMWAAVRYVEQNPVSAGMVKKAVDYKWSSARAHCGLCDDPILTQGIDPPGMFDRWDRTLEEVPEKDIIERIENCTVKGLPCGSRRFVESMLPRMNRKISNGKRGRPKKPDK